MNKAAFLQIVRQVSPIQDQEVEDLEKLVVSFPYCQTAHVLLAKAAHDRGSMLSTQKLRKAAAHVSNRQLLKRLVYDYEFSTPAAEAVETPPTIQEPVFAETEHAVLGVNPENEAESGTHFSLQEEVVEPEIEAPTSVETDFFFAEEEMEGEEVGIQEEEEVATEAAEEENFSPEPELVEVAPSADELIVDEPASNVEETLQEEAEPLEVQLEDHSVTAAAQEVEPAASATPAPEPPTSAPPKAEEQVPEEELLDLIQINSLFSYTPAYKSVDLTHQEIVSEIVSATEARHKAVDAPLPTEADPDIASLPEDQSVAAASPQPEDEDVNAVAPAAPSPLPEEAGYPFPTLQLPVAQILAEQNVAEDPYLSIYTQNSLGFWMGSSRLGESIQLKDELTSSLPNYFQPALIIEHVKGNGTFQKEAEKAPVAKLDIQLDIINQFLKATPRRKTLATVQQNHEPQEDLSAKSVKIKKNFASENLAQIFVKQGKVKKAVKIYEQLIVKFPEKKSYFAQQIEKLRDDT